MKHISEIIKKMFTKPTEKIILNNPCKKVYINDKAYILTGKYENTLIEVENE